MWAFSNIKYGTFCGNQSQELNKEVLVHLYFHFQASQDLCQTDQTNNLKNGLRRNFCIRQDEGVGEWDVFNVEKEMRKQTKPESQDTCFQIICLAFFQVSTSVDIHIEQIDTISKQSWV